MKNDDLKKELDKFNGYEVAEQTLLTWIQAGLTLIGFGFGLGSIIAFLRAEHYEKFIIKTIVTVAELLIVVGIVSIILALIQHRSKLRNLESKEFRYKPTFNLSIFVGIMISILGIVAFLAILIHMIF